MASGIPLPFGRHFQDRSPQSRAVTGWSYRPHPCILVAPTSQVAVKGPLLTSLAPEILKQNPEHSVSFFCPNLEMYTRLVCSQQLRGCFSGDRMDGSLGTCRRGRYLLDSPVVVQSLMWYRDSPQSDCDKSQGLLRLGSTSHPYQSWAGGPRASYGLWLLLRP